MAVTPKQKAILDQLHDHVSGKLTGPSSAPATLPASNVDHIIHDDVAARSNAARTNYEHNGSELNAGGRSYDVRTDLNTHEVHTSNLDYARRAGHDEATIKGHTDAVAQTRTNLQEGAQQFGATAGDALHAHHDAHTALVTERDTHLAELGKTRDKAVAEVRKNMPGTNAAERAARDAEIKAITDRHTAAAEHVTSTYKDHIDHHAGQLEQIGHDVRDVEAATGKSLATNLGTKGAQALEKTEATLGKKLGTAGVSTAVATEQAAVKAGGNMITNIPGNIAKNWKSGTFGKVTSVAGGAMALHGGYNLVKDLGSMMSSEKGLDKNGQPLPSPGIMNVGFDIVEAGLGTVLATGKVGALFGRGH